MLKRRLIPKLQLKPVQLGQNVRMGLVTTVRFNEIIEVGEPVSQAKIYQAQAADELVFVNIRPAAANRESFLKIVRKAAEVIFMPITVGGGVSTLEDFRDFLSNGADKVCVNTAALANPSLIDSASNAFGAQCVVLSIDFRRDESGKCVVWSESGTHATGLDPVEWAVEGEKRGAGEILLTSIDRDGTKSGLDIEAIRSVTEAVKIPVIASGGCGLARHFTEGFAQGKADAVSAGTFFCFQDQNPIQTRSHIRNAGIPIRLHT